MPEVTRRQLLTLIKIKEINPNCIGFCGFLNGDIGRDELEK